MPSGKEIEGEMDVSDPQNFITNEINKAIEELTMIGDVGLGETGVRSPRSAGSGGSKMSELAEITLEELNQFSEVVIDIESMTDISDPTHK